MGVPTAIYTMFGGVQAVTWTDVKQMFLIVFGLIAAFAFLIVSLPDTVSVADALHIAGTTGRLQTFDFRLRPDRPLHVLVRHASASLFLFLSYFGTDQSQVQRYLTAQVGRRSARVALHERLLEDPAAGAGADHRRVRVRVLPVHAAADALQSPCTRRRCATARAAPNTRRSSSASRRRRSTARRRPSSWPTADRADDRRGPAFADAGFTAWNTEVKAVRQTAVALVKDVSGDCVLQRRQLRLSDLGHDAAAGRPGRPDPRGDLRRRDVDDLRRARVALDGHRHRLLPALDPRRGRRSPLAERVAAGDRFLGPVRLDRRDLLRGARLADRSRQPLRVVLLRHRFSASSCWRSAGSAPPATARSSG